MDAAKHFLELAT